MPSTQTPNLSVLSQLTPEALHALKSLPPSYDRLLQSYRARSLSRLQLALLSVYLVKTAARYSSLSTERKRELALKGLAPNGVK